VTQAQVADFFSDMSIVDDPFSYYEYARQQGPVWKEPYHGAYVVTGYDELQAIYREPETFSSCNAFGGPFPGLPEQPAADDASELIEKYRDVFPSCESLITRHLHRGPPSRAPGRRPGQDGPSHLRRRVDTRSHRGGPRSHILFSGGQGTAARFLGNIMRFIAEESALQGLLRTARDRIPNFVEETLRMFSPVKTSFRMARHRATLGGTKIPAGSTLLLLLGAADRDEHRFECPGEFRMDRANSREHVAFGRGIHSCPGAPLVSADGRITLERMLDRLGDIQISEAWLGPPAARRYEYTRPISLEA
jgi:cytochrome P450